MVYAVICKKGKCKKKAYLGETKRMLKFHLADHCGCVRNQTLDKAIGEHFSLPGHSVSDLSITIIEQSKEMIICIQKKDKGILQKEEIFGWVSFILCA